MYAIVEVNGKQYKVVKEEVVKIDKIDKSPGEKLTFENVLFLSDEKEVKVGCPYVEKVKISAEVVEEVKDKKIVVFKYKRRKSSSRKLGHRQRYTLIKINDIVQ
jgi:large subunit ribosomal protein L21